MQMVHRLQYTVECYAQADAGANHVGEREGGGFITQSSLQKATTRVGVTVITVGVKRDDGKLAIIIMTMMTMSVCTVLVCKASAP